MSFAASLLCACSTVLPVLFLCAAPSTAGQDGTDAAALAARVAKARGGPGWPPATLSVEGTFTVNYAEAGEEPVARGTFREIHAGADRARHTAEMEGITELETGVTGDVAWELNPMLGAKVRTGAQAAALRRYFALLRGARAADLYKDMARAGSSELDGREHALLRMTSADGATDTWHVDLESAQVRRVDITLPTLEDNVVMFGFPEEMEARVSFADWRKVGAGSYPYRRTLEMGSMTLAFTCTKVEAGAALAADAFALPAGVRDAKHAAESGAAGAYQIVERPAQPVASIRVKCQPQEISATLAELLPEVLAHLNASGARMAGVPFSRYHAFGPDGIDIEAGIPVAKHVPAKGRVKNGELPAGKAVMVWHMGEYEKLSAAHEALRAYLVAHDLKPRGGPWEIYWTDPGMVPDPAKWRTQIFAPIAD